MTDTETMPPMPLIVHGRLWDAFDRPPVPGWLALAGGRVVSRHETDTPPPDSAGPRIGGRDRLVLPAFVDAHVHLPQIGQVGCEAPDLLTWLETAILPAEARWADPDWAVREATHALARLLAAGTTVAAAYLSGHAGALDAAAEATRRVPVRLLAGQSLMDRAVPEAARDAPLLPLPPAPGDGARLTPTVNPRFAVSCTPELLRRAGDAARAAGTLVQTHLSEQPAECRRVAELFPEAPHYAGVYDAAGLLGPHAVLAHAIHLAPEEWRLLAERDAVVAHCPTANAFLASGILDLRSLREHGVRLALGTDLAAGPDASMPRVARAMTDAARLRRACVDERNPVPTAAEAWHAITAGNAAALGLADRGRLVPGQAADLLVLDAPVPDDAHLAGRLLHGWDPAWIESRVVDGRAVAPDLLLARAP